MTCTGSRRLSRPCSSSSPPWSGWSCSPPPRGGSLLSRGGCSRSSRTRRSRPSGALPTIVGMLLAVGLEPYAHGPAKVVFLIFFVVTILFGGWVTGQWFVGELDPVRFHPGYLLPTVAGGFVGAEGCAIFGLTGLGWLSFGIGTVCWLMLGASPSSTASSWSRRCCRRRWSRPLAIELAPPAVGGVAYLSLHGAVADPVAYVFAGYTGLMILVELRLIPLYARTPFSPAFWSFTFAWCAAAGLAIRWLAIEHPGGETLWATLVVAAASLLVIAIATRTLLDLCRGGFLPPDPEVIPPAGGGDSRTRSPA